MFTNDSEAMATRNAVLSQSPEFKEARIRAFRLATAIYDLLTFALVLWGQYNMLYEVGYYLCIHVSDLKV